MRDTIGSQSSVTWPAGLDVGLGHAEASQMGGVAPDMVWVRSFPNTLIRPYPGSLGEGSAFEKALGDSPGILLVENPLFERLPCTGHQENHKAVYFPTYDKR